MTTDMSYGKKIILFMILLLLVILSGVAIGYKLYKNKEYNMIYNKQTEEEIKFIENSETGLKVKLDKDCDVCTLSVNLIDNIRKGILRTYDIKILDSNGKVKNVKNTDIIIKIPIDEELKKYSDYKLLYIDNNQILKTYSTYTDDGYIVLKTTQLGIYGIDGTIIPDI